MEGDKASSYDTTNYHGSVGVTYEYKQNDF